MFLHFPVKFIGFLELELSDVPALLCGLLYGPIAGICVELIKNLLHMMASSTAMVGELANFLIASSYVAGVSGVFWYTKSQKRLRNGFMVGTVLLVIFGVIINYFIAVIIGYAQSLQLQIVTVLTVYMVQNYLHNHFHYL